MFQRFSHVMLYAVDPVRSGRWYTDNLGFEVLFSSEHYASMRHPATGLQLDLHGTDQVRSNGGSPWFRTSDIDASVRTLRALGVRVDDPTRREGIPAHTQLYDPDGNVIGLQEGA